MSEKILTFELSADRDEIEIHGNRDGLKELIDSLHRLFESSSGDTSSHDHLMTPAWGGRELSEEKQGQKTILVNKVTIHLWR